MKRFLLAALLALTIHGLFFGFVPRPVEKTRKKPHIITISLASYSPVKAKPAAKPARIMDERSSQKPPKKKENAVIRPLPVKKTVKEPPEILEPNKKALKHPEKAVRPKKKRIKPPKKEAPKHDKKVIKPKAKPKAPAKTVTASLIPEKKKVSLTPPQSNRTSRPTKDDPAIPIKEAANPEEYPAPFRDIPEDSAVEGETEVASIAPVKVVREARPAYKDNPRPRYPKRAKRRGYEGTVLLEVLVDRNGRVKELRILTSSGHSVLDRAALKSVKGWLFEPGMVGDEKVDMWVRVPVRFELRGG